MDDDDGDCWLWFLISGDERMHCKKMNYILIYTFIYCLDPMPKTCLKMGGAGKFYWEISYCMLAYLWVSECAAVEKCTNSSEGCNEDRECIAHANIHKQAHSWTRLLHNCLNDLLYKNTDGEATLVPKIKSSKTLRLNDLNACFLQRFLSHMVIKLYFCLSAKLFLQFLKVNLGNYLQRDTLGTDFVRLCCFCQKIIDAKSLVNAHSIFLVCISCSLRQKVV